MTFPIRYHESNIILNEFKEPFAVYMINGFEYDLISDDKKISRLYQTARLLNLIKGRGKIIGKPYFSSIRDHNDQLKKRFKGPSHLVDLAKYRTDEITKYLIKMRGDEGNEIIPFIVVKLFPEKKTQAKMNKLKDFTSQAIRTFDELMNLQSFELLESEWEALKDAENVMFQQINQRIPASRVSDLDIEWLQKQPFFRSVGDPKLRNHSQGWRPGMNRVIKDGMVTVSPRDSEVQSLYQGDIHVTRKRHIVIEHDDNRKSYQSFLCIANLPDMQFPNGCEWLYQLKTLPFPVEYVLDLEPIDNRKMKERVRNKKNEVDDQVGHTAEVTNVPIALQNAMHESVEIEYEIKQTRDSWFNASVDICVSAKSEEELKRRVDEVKLYFDDFEIEVQNPSTDQHRLFMGFFPGGPRGSERYLHKLSPLTLAGSMFTATDQIGDTEGICIGYYGRLKKPVYINPARAPQVDKSPSMSNTGTLGGGKSFLADLIGYWNGITGGKTLWFDPKNDRTEWLNKMPELKGFMEIITLSGKDEDVGKLDPFMLYDIPNKTGAEKEEAKREAFSLATAVLAYVANTATDSEEFLGITEACKFARDSEVPCMREAINFMETGYLKNEKLVRMKPVFEKLSMQIANMLDFSNASLLLGDGKNSSLKIERPMTILQIQNLTLPKKRKERKDMTEIDEIISMALLYPIAKFALKFIHTDRSIFKVVVMDESWALKATPKGKDMIDELVREGRAMNAGTTLIGQNADDVDEDMKNNIGLKFAFKSSDIKQVEATLSYFNLEKTDYNIRLIQNIPKYHTLMQDLDGRTKLIRVDAFHQDLIEAFNTRPKTHLDLEKEEVSDEAS